MGTFTDHNHVIQTVSGKDESFIVKRLGIVRGVSPVSIVSKNSNSYLTVYNDAFFNGKALIYNLNNFNQPYRQLKRISGLDHVRFSNSGTILAAASSFSHFRFSGLVYKVKNDHLIPVLGERYYGRASVGGGSQMFSLNQDESLMVIASSVFNNSKLRIFDISNINEPTGIFTMNPPGKAFETKSLCWSPDGTIVAHHGHYIETIVPFEKLRGVFLWKIDRDSSSISVKHIGTLTYESNNHDDIMVDLAFSPDCRLLVLGADKKSSDKIKLFNLNSQQLVFESAPLGTTTASLLFTPNGKYLISGEKDGCVHIWNVGLSSLTLARTIDFSGEIFQICISNEKKQLLVAHKDGKKTVVVSSVSFPEDML